MRDSRTEDPTAVRGGPWHRAAAIWRTRLRPGWIGARPLVLLGLALLVIVLGVIGYERYDTTEQFSFLDSLYRTIQLFAFGGAVTPPVPWELDVARVLGPVLAGWAAIRGLLALSREQVQILGLRILLRDHVIVAGLGDAGFRLATALHEAGLRVVVIERDPANPRIGGCRERLISVLKGDAADPRILARARVTGARYLIVTCGDDGTDVAVAEAARRLGAKRRRTLTAFVHIEDLGLWRALQARAVAEAAEDHFRLELFNTFDAAARALIEEHPPFSAADEARPVLLVGLEGIGESLLLNLAGHWRRERREPGARLKVTLAGPDAVRQRASLLVREPDLEDLCELEVLPVDLDSPALRESGEVEEAGVVYVALDDEAEGLSVALAVVSETKPGVAVVVAVRDEHAGVAMALASSNRPELRTFGVLTRALEPALLLRGTTEVLARAKHEEYRRSQSRAGETLEQNPSLAPWDELPESLKESNRRFAEGIGAKLRAVGCEVVPAPLIDPGGRLLSFANGEVEELARLEHDRWAADLLRDGWKPTDGSKDPERKLHPLLVGWSELPESEREKDRQPMRELPVLLAQAGLELYRAGQR